MPTAINSATSYASGADAVAYRDYRQWADLLKDDDTRYTTAAATAADATLARTLSWASGRIEAACLTAGTYAAADLAALTGVGLEYLKGLVCDLAFWRLSARRKVGLKPEDVSGARQALDDLEALRLGELAFGLQEVVDASKGEAYDVQPQSSDQELNRPSIQAGRLFGDRTHDPR